MGGVGAHSLRGLGVVASGDEATEQLAACVEGRSYCTGGEAGFVPSHGFPLSTAFKSLLSLLFNTFL